MKKLFSKWKVWLAIVIITIQFINGAPFFFGDAYGYYHTTKTIITQGQFNTDNMPSYTAFAGHGVVFRDDGQAISVYPPGVSILWWPFFKAASFFDNGTIYTDYFKAFNGHSLADGLAVVAASSFYTYLAVLMMVDFLKRHGFKTGISLFAIAAAYVSTYAVSYMTEQPGYTHTYEIFAVSLFLFCLERLKDTPNKKLYYVGSGAAAGLLTSIRVTDAILFIPMIIVLIKFWRKAPYVILGAAPFLIYLFYYNFINFGNPLANGYAVMWNQHFDFSSFHLFDLLFSDFRGLFFWSPALIFAFVALWIKPRNKWTVCIYAVQPLIILAPYIFWPYWYAGDSIGQRYLIVAVPFIAYGFARVSQVLITQNRGLLYIILLSSILYSGIVAVLYRVSPTPRLVDPASEKAIYYGETQGIPAANLTSPFDIFSYQISLVKESKTPSEYFNRLATGFNGGRSLLLLALGQTDPLVIVQPNSNNSFTMHIVPNPTYKPITANLYLFVEYQSKYMQFSEVDFSKPQSIQIACSSDFCRSDTAFILLDPPVDLPTKYIKVTQDLKIWIDADKRVKFVNEKLLNLD